jgi:hypothetical protein
MEQSSGVMVFSILYYTSLFILVVFLLLVFVHFTIVPIFALTADNPGIIVISGAGDRELSYTDTSYGASPKNKRTPSDKTTRLPQCSYTIGFDIKQVKPTANKTAVLYRAVAVSDTFLSNIQTCSNPNCFNFPDTNILVSTEQGTSDMITIELIESSTKKVAMDKGITISKTWNRICIVLADTFAEVYLNGELVSTIVVGSLKPVGSDTDFFPPTDPSVVKISHMSMWPRILSPKEVRYYESKPMSSE